MLNVNGMLSVQKTLQRYIKDKGGFIYFYFVDIFFNPLDNTKLSIIFLIFSQVLNIFSKDS